MVEYKTIIMVYSSLFLIFILGWVTCSYFEMSAFNRFSEQDATLIDAMFSNLRIMAE